LREAADKFNNLTGMGPVKQDKGEKIQKEDALKGEMEGGSFWQQDSGPLLSGAFTPGTTKNSFAPPISII